MLAGNLDSTSRTLMMTRSFSMTESQLHLGEHIGLAGLNDRADLFDWLLAAAQLLNATACFEGSCMFSRRNVIMLG